MEMPVHIVFIPKYRKKTLYGNLGNDVYTLQVYTIDNITDNLFRNILESRKS